MAKYDSLTEDLDQREHALKDPEVREALEVLIDMDGKTEPVSLDKFEQRLKTEDWDEQGADHLIRYLFDAGLMENVGQSGELVEIHSLSSLRNPHWQS